MSAHLTPESIAGITMLDASDPERVTAEAHARECGSCRAALDDAARVLGALDALAPPPAPSPIALSRAKRAVLAELEREPTPRAPWLESMLVPAASFACFCTLALALPAVRPVVWPVALGVIAVVSLRSALALVRGTARDAGVALALGLGASAVIAVTDAEPSAHGHAAKCIAVELGAALVPLVAVALTVWRGRLRAGALVLATVATSGALAGQLALRASCPDRHLEHLLASHVGGVLAAALLGALVARVPALRRETRAG